jgi:hypothetical protein
MFHWSLLCSSSACSSCSPVILTSEMRISPILSSLRSLSGPVCLLPATPGLSLGPEHRANLHGVVTGEGLAEIHLQLRAGLRSFDPPDSRCIRGTLRRPGAL